MTSMLDIMLTAGPGHGKPTPSAMASGIVAGICVLAAFDATVARWTKARWFAVHAFANAFVVIFGFEDLCTALADPYRAGLGKYSVIPFYFIIAVHLYHMLAFSNLKVGDWVHHILFACVICLFGMSDQYGPMQNVTAFFLSGLPGGLDYLLMFGVKHGWIDINTEKKNNARIMTWIRSPGCLLAAFMLYAAAIKPSERTNFVEWYSPYCAFTTALLCYVNGVFYQQQVLLSTARKDERYSC